DPTGSFGGAASYRFNKTFSAVLAYDQFRSNYNGTAQAPANRGNVENYLAAGRADFGPVFVKLGYRYRDTDLAMAGAAPVKSHLSLLGVRYQFRQGTMVSVSYCNEHFDNAAAGWLGAPGSTVHQLALLGSYGLSKRTELY